MPTRDVNQSPLMLEIGAKLFPRRYRRFRDLRTGEELSRWLWNLDWRENPYDRFLFRREVLRHLEIKHERENPFQDFSRAEIEIEIDRLIVELPGEFEDLNGMAYFCLLLVFVPLNLRSRCR